MPPVRVIEGVTASHRAIEAAVATLDDAALLLPSRRQGWTVGEAIAHLAGSREHSRPVVDLLADLRRRDAALEASLAVEDDLDGALSRWRDVVVHHTDLGVGYDWNDWPADYVRLDLERMTMLWNSRRPMGLTGLPQRALHAPPGHRLAWLLGRACIDGLGTVAAW